MGSCACACTLLAQVSWSKLRPELLTTGHEGGEVYVWDTRRPSARDRLLLQGGALTSLDWNPAVDTELVTSS
jgi:WD40 repeat protein